MTVQKVRGLELERLRAQTTAPRADFKAALAKASDGQLRFSAHAEARMAERSIKLTQRQLQDLTGAVKSLKGKGSRDALVLVDQLAFVVSVKNNTVITLAQRGDLQEQIFTNIDSAVLLDEADRKGPQSH